MTGKMLTEHPGVDKIAFTGSTEVKLEFKIKIKKIAAQSRP